MTSRDLLFATICYCRQLFATGSGMMNKLVAASVDKFEDESGCEQDE